MEQEHLITPAEFVKTGSVTAEKMQQLIAHLRVTAQDLSSAFPDARLHVDSDFILRLEASADDAAAIDDLLQESLTAFTLFFSVRQGLRRQRIGYQKRTSQRLQRADAFQPLGVTKPVGSASARRK